MITTLQQLPPSAAENLLNSYQLNLTWVTSKTIPGSHWGAPEAGIIGQCVYVQAETPVHSFLHETCHIICMDDQRRNQLQTDAGGSAIEESAVCYLQILLSGLLPTYSQARILSDMDEWGYSFRLGSTRRWFEQDAEDACQWLLDRHLIDPQQQPTFRLNH